jgi:arylsulfatase A-like enzyme
LYGDVVAQIDHSTSQILATLKELNLDDKTLILFTSDNGPWLIKKQEGGSAGLLRDGKGTTWEGGMREPCIVRWPGKIVAGSTSPALASTLDVFATCLSLAGIPLPADRKFDSHDLSPVLLKQSDSPRKTVFYYRDVNLMAIRKGPWKLHIKTSGFEASSPVAANLLYQLDIDPSEKYDRAADEPAIVSDLLAEIERHRAEVEPGALQR